MTGKSSWWAGDGSEDHSSMLVVHVHNFLSNQELCGTIWNYVEYVELYWTMWNYIELYYIELYWTIWNYVELYGTIWNYMELCGTIWNYIELYGTILYWTILNYMELCGTILYGTMWNYMELYGTINIIWDHSSEFPTTRSHFSIIVTVMLGAQTWTPGDALVVGSSLDPLTAQNAQPLGLVEGYPLVNQRETMEKKSQFFMGKSTISTWPCLCHFPVRNL